LSQIFEPQKPYLRYINQKDMKIKQRCSHTVENAETTKEQEKHRAKHQNTRQMNKPPITK
jgi:hypothetical protein